jgi:hypothetical protein
LSWSYSPAGGQSQFFQAPDIVTGCRTARTKGAVHFGIVFRNLIALKQALLSTPVKSTSSNPLSVEFENIDSPGSSEEDKGIKDKRSAPLRIHATPKLWKFEGVLYIGTVAKFVPPPERESMFSDNIEDASSNTKPTAVRGAASEILANEGSSVGSMKGDRTVFRIVHLLSNPIPPSLLKFVKSRVWTCRLGIIRMIRRTEGTRYRGTKSMSMGQTGPCST